jgi:hypothetical protein
VGDEAGRAHRPGRLRAVDPRVVDAEAEFVFVADPAEVPAFA